MPRTPNRRAQDFITVGEVRDMLAAMQAEAKANHERLSDGVRTSIERIDNNADTLRENMTNDIASFRKGTRDFGGTVDGRFTNVWGVLGQVRRDVYDLERRTVRGRLRALAVRARMLFIRDVED